MRTRRLLWSLAFVILILACNFPGFAPSTQPPPESILPTQTIAPLSFPTDTPVPTEAGPTFTPIPTLSPTVTITPTPTVPQITPNSVGVNCRYGPDVGFVATSSVAAGQIAIIAGKNAGGSWWYVQDPNNPGGYCWVAASVVTAAGNLSNIPIVPTPLAQVTKVTVDASVGSASCGSPNPVTFSGTISTNGPVTVTYQWEVRGDKENTTSPETLIFDKAGKKDVPDPGAYKVDCGNYSITLHILSPNETSAKKKFSLP